MGFDMSDLTDKQRAYVLARSDGATTSVALAMAGYAQNNGGTSQVEANPKVYRAVQELTARRLQAAAPVALKVIRELMEDASVGPRIRLDAAKTLLDRAGFIPPKQAVESEALNPSEMTAEQLHQQVSQLEAELANRAVVVDSEPTATQHQDEPLDFLE